VAGCLPSLVIGGWLLAFTGDWWLPSLVTGGWLLAFTGDWWLAACLH